MRTNLLFTSFDALYARSKQGGLMAISTLPEPRKKVRPSIYIGQLSEKYGLFAPTSTSPSSMNLELVPIPLQFAPGLDRQSYLDPRELWVIPNSILNCFRKCFSTRIVDEVYVHNSVYPMYLSLISDLKADIRYAA